VARHRQELVQRPESLADRRCCREWRMTWQGSRLR
jgi:hypothetical protein